MTNNDKIQKTLTNLELGKISADNASHTIQEIMEKLTKYILPLQYTDLAVTNIVNVFLEEEL